MNAYKLTAVFPKRRSLGWSRKSSMQRDSSMPATHCILLFPKQKKTLCTSEFQVANSLGVTTQRFKNSFINKLFIKNNLAI